MARGNQPSGSPGRDKRRHGRTAKARRSRSARPNRVFRNDPEAYEEWCRQASRSFRNDPEAYEEWCRQASRFRAAEFLAGWRSSTTWSGRALKCMPFGNFVDRAMICTTGPCDQSARTVPHDSKGTLPVSLGRRNHRLGGSPARGVPRRSALRLVHRRGGGIPRRRVCGPDATPSEARVGQ